MDLQAAVTAMQAARHRVARPGRKAEPIKPGREAGSKSVVSGGAGGWDMQMALQLVRREQPEG